MDSPWTSTLTAGRWTWRRLPAGFMGRTIGFRAASITLAVMGYSPVHVQAWSAGYDCFGLPVLHSDAPEPNCVGMRSRRTSGRTPFNPMGNSHFGFVASGNLLCSRVLLICTCELLGLRYLVEQPGSSFLGNMPSWQQVVKNLRSMTPGSGWGSSMGRLRSPMSSGPTAET